MPNKRKTVLVVEDQMMNRRIINKILSAEYEVVEAENGQIGLDILKKNSKISAILLDLYMPVMDGFAFLVEMKNCGKEHIPVVVMTAENDTEVEEKALDYGAIDFIFKPVNPKILKSRLRNAVIRNQMYLLNELRKQADYDELTGLYNRKKMFSETKKMIDAHPEVQFVIVRFDIDQFRLYNSAMGEEEGNNLLKFVANKIYLIADKFNFCTYGRIDADVFCVCKPYDEELLKKHMKLVQEELSNYRNDYKIQSSFGIYIIESSSDSVEAMYTRASMAADKCKNLYNAHYAYYERSMSEKVLEEKDIVNEMQSALNQEQFQVYLQPKYDLSTNMPCGAEALVRWRHPEKGLIAPGKFIPVFEKNGFIFQLDYYMWENVCRLLHKWKETGKKVAPVSVNMSRVSLYNPHVSELMLELTKKYGVEPALLNLEVTESAYMSNPELMKEIISNLKKAGFQIMMDDFGSGYSSLNTLKEIQVDILKIDMKFLPNGNDNGRSEKILSSIVRMAGWLGMPVIAEGVEDQKQRDFLENIGCGYVQGYYYAKPMPVPEYEALMDKVAELPRMLQQSGTEILRSVWSSNEQIDEILKGISLPVAVYEYSSMVTELVRVNQSYLDYFGLTYTDEDGKKLSYENEMTVKNCFKQAALSDKSAECQYSFINKKGQCTWQRMKVRRLGSISKSTLLCCVFMDITNEVFYEQQLEKMEMLLTGKTGKEKLLVIDDVFISREIVRAMFQDKYEVLEAENGKKAIELLKENSKDLSIILLDLIMPEMGGEEFLAYKNEMPELADIPVIVISSEDDAATQLGMLRMGVNDYITKPFDREIMEQRIQNVIENSHRFKILMAEYKKAIGNKE